MLCRTCFRMLRGQDSRQWKGTNDLNFIHHDSVQKLKISEAGFCRLCQGIWEELKMKLSPTEPNDAERLFITASLSAITSVMSRTETTQSWRLDFKIDYAEISTKRTFVLKEISPCDPATTTKSWTTGSDEVLNVVLQWLDMCKCAKQEPGWSPTRLLDIRHLKRNPIAKPYFSRDKRPLDKTEVPLVATKDWKAEITRGRDHHYVTLSHRWGSPKRHHPKLTSENIEHFEKGIRINSLPKTFRDAIQFAARLPLVGYIWIDSLCIKQGDTDDWLTESALMTQVYSKSFLNISATAASDSTEGLFFRRNPENIPEDEVSLSIEGIPVTWEQAVGIHAHSSPDEWKPYSWRSSNVRRCIILDPSLWTNRVNQAPVNQRAWVLQERLLCPRILHFCKDQVAWECSEFDAAESRQHGLPNYQLTSERLIQESSPFKTLDPMRNGRALRSARLKGLPDSLYHLQPQIYAFELWKWVVEVYSRTKLTNSADKLIALSGIARLMASHIGSEKAPSEYIAGLWRPKLASQLLWRVEPIFLLNDSTFEHSGRRPSEYRAPSFTWAAIDTEGGDGITYAEITDKEIYITIEEAKVTPMFQDPFGMVKDGHLTIRGRLQHIALTKRNKGRFCWTIKGNEELSKEAHTNVYLDSVQDTDFDTDDVYCLPTAKGGYLGTGDSNYIFCLLLRLKNEDLPLRLKDTENEVFERIGFTKLSSWADKETYKQILRDRKCEIGSVSEEKEPSEGGRPRFHLI